MPGHQRRRPISVAVRDRVDQGQVLVVATSRLARRLVDRNDQRRARDQFLEEFRQHGIAAHLREIKVKLPRQFDPVSPVAPAIGGMLVIDQHAQGAKLGIAHRPGEVADDGLLDDAARLEHVARLFGRRTRDDRAAVRPDAHNVLVRQAEQRLAHHRPAHAENLAECVLGQFGAWGQAMIQDGIVNLAVNRVIVRNRAPRLVARERFSLRFQSRIHGLTHFDSG